jgi:hypothetical protein
MVVSSNVMEPGAQPRPGRFTDDGSCVRGDAAFDRDDVT